VYSEENYFLLNTKAC